MPVQSWKIKSHVIQQRAGVFFCRRAAFQIRTIRTNPTGSFVPILTSSRTARTSHTLVSIYGADASTVRRPASQAIASKQASKLSLERGLQEGLFGSGFLSSPFLFSFVHQLPSTILTYLLRYCRILIHQGDTLLSLFCFGQRSCL